MAGVEAQGEDVPGVKGLVVEGVEGEGGYLVFFFCVVVC